MSYRARTIFAGVLVWIGVLLVGVASPAWFGRQVIRDEDRFVDTVADVTSDERVREKVAELISREVLELAGLELDPDAEEETEEGADGTTQPDDSTTTGLEDLDLGLIFGDDIATDAQILTLQLLNTTRGEQVFLDSIRRLHGEIIKVIDEESDVVLIDENAAIHINLRPILVDVVDDLVARDETSLLANIDVPADAGSFIVTEDRGAISLILSYFRIVDDTVSKLAVAAVILFLAAVIISEERGNTLMQIGGGLAFVSVFFIGFIYAGKTFLSWLFIRDDLARDAFRIAYGDLVSPFQQQEVRLLIVGVALLILGWVLNRFFYPDAYHDYPDSHYQQPAQSSSDQYAGWAYNPDPADQAPYESAPQYQQSGPYERYE